MIKNIKLKKIFCLLLAAVFFFNIFFCDVWDIKSDDDVNINIKNNNLIYIRDQDDLFDLVKNCFDNTWSDNKKIILENDIKLDLDSKKNKFRCIPVFNGIFDGQGYKITGLKFNSDANNFAFFKYLKERAIIKNLEINFDLEPNGSQKNIAGIAAINYGEINNCVFKGNIKAKNYVGGIAAVNHGKIINSKSYGKILGEHYVGGICGQNFGEIIVCENNSCVNNLPLNIEHKIEPEINNNNNLELKNIISMENFIDITDIGGIAGFSSGIIKDCVNNNQIGHNHIGYNIGGICGRQNNYIYNCVNNNKVYGRKDIGGICGQAEPYTSLNYSEDKNIFDKVSNNLDELHDLLNTLFGNSKNVRRDSLNKILLANNYIQEAQKYINKMTDSSSNYVNKGVDKINNAVLKTSESLNNINVILKKIAAESRDINNIIREYKNALDFFDKAYDEINISNSLNGLDKLSEALIDIADIINNLLDAIENIKNNLGDLDDFKYALENINERIEKLSDAYKNMTDILLKLESDINGLVIKIKTQDIKIGDEQSLLLVFNAFVSFIDAVKNNFDVVSRSIEKVGYNLTLFNNYLVNLNTENLKQEIKIIKENIRNIGDALLKINESIDYFSKALKEIDSASKYLKNGIDSARKTSDKLINKLDLVINNFDLINDEIEKFSREPILNLDKISDDFLDDKDKLLDCINNISNVIFDLCNDLNSRQDIINNNIQDVLDKTFDVFDLFKSEIDNKKNKSLDPKDYFKDVSDLDNDKFTQGKIKSCINYGFINGDLNIGGISGTMSIEYDFDPEEDIIKDNNKNFDFVYKAKAVIKDCKNYGCVESKKNYVGGIVGKADLGVINNSLSTGIIKSNNGGYVGGIAGYSGFLIKNCCSKNILAGKNNLGGIAGLAHNIFDCNALPFLTEIKKQEKKEDNGDDDDSKNNDVCKNLDLEYDENKFYGFNDREFIGGIAGEIDNDGEFKNCYFVEDNYLGAIDNINYKNKAESIGYDNFVLLRNLFDELRYFMVYFFDDDGSLIKEIKINYGERLDKNLIPDLKSKNDYFGEWNIKNLDDINIKHDYYISAVYDNYISCIESDNKRENSLPVFVAEGKFNFESELKAKEKALDKNNVYELEAWEININNSLDKKIKVHYLPKDIYKKNKNVIIKVFENGRWHKKNFVYDGSYLVFDMNLPKEKIKIERKKFWF